MLFIAATIHPKLIATDDVDRTISYLALAKPLPCQLRAGTERAKLGLRDIPAHRRHAAIGGGHDLVLRHHLHDGGDGLGDVLGGFHRVAGDIDDTGLHHLAGEQFQQVERHPRVAAFDRDLLNGARGNRREDILILPPLAAERRLPVGVGLDAVAVADVHGGGAGQPLCRALQRFDAPFLDFAHIDVEGGLIELDDVDAVGLQRVGFLVQQVGERERHLDAVAVMAVGNGVDDGHRAGQSELQLVRGMGAGGLRFERMNAPLQAQRRHHLRHHRLVAVGADSHLHLVGKIDALDVLQEAVHEMLPRLLPLGDDVDPRIFLQLDRKQGGVALGGGKLLGRRLPRRPQAIRLGKPFGFG